MPTGAFASNEISFSVAAIDAPPALRVTENVAVPGVLPLSEPTWITGCAAAVAA
jgi:hypothetical protein